MVPPKTERVATYPGLSTCEVADSGTPISHEPGTRSQETGTPGTGSPKTGTRAAGTVSHELSYLFRACSVDCRVGEA